MRVYAQREDDGRRALVAIKCDDCGIEIKPSQDIATSGWIKYGWDNGIGTDKSEYEYCPKCAGVRGI